MTTDDAKSGGLDEQDEPVYGEEFSEDELVEFFWNSLARSKEVVEPVLEDATKLEKMYAKDSLSPTDESYLTQTDRPAIDWPFASGIVEALLGAEMAQRTEAVFDGTDAGPVDAIFADWTTQVVRFLNGKCEGHRHQTEAYRDCLISGYGFVGAHLDLTRIPIRPRVEHKENWAVYFDPDATEPNLTDAKFWIEEAEWSREEVEAKWYEKRDEIRRAVRSTGISAPTPRPSQDRVWARGHIDSKKQGLAVYRFEYLRFAPKAVYYDPERDERVDSTRAEYDARKAELDGQAEQMLAQHAIAMIEQEQQAALADPLAPPIPPEPPPDPPRLSDAHFYAGKIHYVAHILGHSKGEGLVLDGPTPISVNEFTYKAVTGFAWKDYSTKRVRRFGIMRKIHDAQIYLNMALRTYLEIMARGSKGGGFIEEDALPEGTTMAQFLKDRSRPGYWSMLRSGAIAEGKIHDAPTQSTPAGFEQIYRMCVEAFGLLTGVTQALQGTLTGDRSNVAISNLQEQGLQMLLPIREPRTAFTVQLGRLMAALAVQHLPVEDLDKILGEQIVEGLTHQQAEPDPQTGQVPVDPKTRKPQLVPIPSEEVDEATGEPKPVTPGMLLKGANLLEYDITVDVGVATPTQRQASWMTWSQHNMLQTMLDAQAPAKILLPAVVKNAPLPGVEAKKLADDLERYYADEELKGTEEGVMKFFSEVPPEQAAQLLQQIQQMIAGPGQGEPAAEMPVQ